MHKVDRNEPLQELIEKNSQINKDLKSYDINNDMEEIFIYKLLEKNL